MEVHASLSLRTQMPLHLWMSILANRQLGWAIPISVMENPDSPWKAELICLLQGTTHVRASAGRQSEQCWYMWHMSSYTNKCSPLGRLLARTSSTASEAKTILSSPLQILICRISKVGSFTLIHICWSNSEIQCNLVSWGLQQRQGEEEIFFSSLRYK